MKFDPVGSFFPRGTCDLKVPEEPEGVSVALTGHPRDGAPGPGVKLCNQAYKSDLVPLELQVVGISPTVAALFPLPL